MIGDILPEQSGVEGKGILCTFQELFLQPAVKIPNAVATREALQATKYVLYLFISWKVTIP